MVTASRARASVLAFVSATAGAGCALFAGLEDKELLVAGDATTAADSPASEGGSDAGTIPTEVVLSGLARPRGLAVDPTAVYFAEEGAGFVKRLRRGETTPVVMAKELRTPVEVLLDSAYVYVRSENRSTTPLDGGQIFYDSMARLAKDEDERTKPMTLWFEPADRPSEIRSIALYEPTGRVENILFFTRQERVQRKGRGSNGGEQDIQNGVSRPTVVTADDEWVYWVSEGDYSIRRQKKLPTGVDGGPPPGPEKIHSSEDRVFALALAVDDQSVFWLDQRGRVFRRGKEPGAPDAVELATSESTASGALVLDRENVFWVNGDRGVVATVSKSGASAKRVLATGQDQPRALAIDTFETPERVLWSNATSILAAVVR